MALASNAPLSIKNTSGSNRNIAQEVDGNYTGSKSLSTLGTTAGVSHSHLEGVSLLDFLGYSSITIPTVVWVGSTSGVYDIFGDYYWTISENVTSDGGAFVTSAGFLIGLINPPTFANTNKYSVNGTGTGIFATNLYANELEVNPTYNLVRCYATNSVGTGYSSYVFPILIGYTPVWFTSLRVSSTTTNSTVYAGLPMSIISHIKNWNTTSSKNDTLAWKITDTSYTTISSGTVSSGNIPANSDTTPVTITTNAPISLGTYYAATKINKHNSWIYSNTFTTVTAPLLAISDGYSGFWYFDEFGNACSNNGEWDTITVTCAVAWTLLPGGSFVHAEPHSVTGNAVVTVIVDPLGGYLSSRQSIITFSVGGIQQAVAHIWQMAPGEACY